METGNEKVCRRCGTLNDERSLMCVRCGETLEMSEEKKSEIFKGRILSEKTLIFLFVILFTAYSFGAIFYVFPWIYNKLIWVIETYMFNLFKKFDLIYIIIEVLYSLIIFLINYIAVAIILYYIVGSKLTKKSKLNGTCVFIFLYMILCFILMTIYKHKIDYVIMIEHLMSVIITFPYIKRRVIKRSI